MSAYSMESIDGMSSLELTLIAFQSGRVIAGAHHQMSPAEEQAKETFVAAYMELLRRPPETGTVHSRSSRSPLTWKCSHVGFEMSHPQFGMVGMVRDRRSSSGYRIVTAAPSKALVKAEDAARAAFAAVAAGAGQSAPGGEKLL